jgi:membrane protein implicated in regulation of membrane protease activity
MYWVLMIAALAVGVVALIGLTLWGLASLLLLALSAFFLWIAWKVRPRAPRTHLDRRT